MEVVEEDDNYYEDLANLYNMASAMSVAGTWQTPKRPQQPTPILPAAIAPTARATVQTGSARYCCVDGEDYYEDLVALYTMASAMQIEEANTPAAEIKKQTSLKKKLVRSGPKKVVKPATPGKDPVGKKTLASEAVEFPLLIKCTRPTIGDALLMITDENVSGMDKFTAAVASGDEKTVLDVLNNPDNKYFLRRYDSSGRTALHLAVKNKQWATLDILLKDPTLCLDALNQEGVSALHLAVLLGRQELVAALLAAGANIFVNNSKGETTLNLAQGTSMNVCKNWLRKPTYIALSKFYTDHVTISDLVLGAPTPLFPVCEELLSLIQKHLHRPETKLEIRPDTRGPSASISSGYRGPSASISSGYRGPSASISSGCAPVSSGTSSFTFSTGGTIQSKSEKVEKSRRELLLEAKIYKLYLKMNKTLAIAHVQDNDLQSILGHVELDKVATFFNYVVSFLDGRISLSELASFTRWFVFQMNSEAGKHVPTLESIDQVSVSNLYLPWGRRPHLKKWTKCGVFYTQLIPPASDHYRYLLHFLQRYMNLGPLKCASITQVYNRQFVKDFGSFMKKVRIRHTENPSLFKRETWKTDLSQQERQKSIMRFYWDYTKQFSWNNVQGTNKDFSCHPDPEFPIVPILHGTDLGTALKICATGFTTVASLDDGYYGQGMYFSTQALYTLPYFAGQRNPCLILCYGIPGNVYPVIEHPSGPDNLLGKPVKKGYQSHYVVTNMKGEIYNEGDGNTYDEFVMFQEAQVVPAYIINLDRSNLRSLLSEFNRAIIEPKEKIILKPKEILTLSVTSKSEEHETKENTEETEEKEEKTHTEEESASQQQLHKKPRPQFKMGHKQLMTSASTASLSPLATLPSLSSPLASLPSLPSPPSARQTLQTSQTSTSSHTQPEQTTSSTSTISHLTHTQSTSPLSQSTEASLSLPQTTSPRSTLQTSQTTTSTMSQSTQTPSTSTSPLTQSTQTTQTALTAQITVTAQTTQTTALTTQTTVTTQTTQASTNSLSQAQTVAEFLATKGLATLAPALIEQGFESKEDFLELEMDDLATLCDLLDLNFMKRTKLKNLVQQYKLEQGK